MLHCACKTLRLAVFLLLLLSSLAPVASATTYYLDPVVGNDGNSGTSVGAPKKTLPEVWVITFSNIIIIAKSINA